METVITILVTLAWLFFGVMAAALYLRHRWKRGYIDVEDILAALLFGISGPFSFFGVLGSCYGGKTIFKNNNR